MVIHNYVLLCTSKYIIVIIILNKLLSIRSIKNEKIIYFILVSLILSLYRSKFLTYIIFVLLEEKF